ncbi:MAG: hypothetical protein HZA78_07630 [Candidatus Schekmanbacteria bacterium]|nr:hypothetical protein [Candidatus Schekmanbacteria bacterium]
MYLTTIEEFYNQRRGKGLILSPKDWQLACVWQEQGIPVKIVLRGIESALSKADSAKEIRSLAYCDQEIRRLFQEHIKQMAGAPPNSASQTETGQVPYIIAQLEELKTGLNTSMMLTNESGLIEKLQQTYLQIQELSKNPSDDWQVSVKQIAVDLIACLNQIIPDDQAVLLKKAAQKHLQGYENRMSREAYQKTLDILIREQLLAEFSLEAFSLYAGIIDNG